MNATAANATAVVTTSAPPRNTMYAWFQNYANPTVVTQLYQIGYSIIFLLGFPGNIASLLTFSRPTLRKVSTGCLFIVLAVSDTLYLLMCIFDYLEFGFTIDFYSRLAYNDFCRFRYFIMYVAQFASAWILVIVSIDRWIRTRFPFKSGVICTPKKALMAVGVVLFIDVGLHSHLLSPLHVGFLPGLAVGACGPNFGSMSYVMFFYMQWSIIQIFTTCVAPAMFMLVVVIDIIISVRLRKNAFARQNQAWEADKSAQRKKALQKQMFILMFGSVCIFLCTSLPVGIYKIISPRGTNLLASFLSIITVWTGLGWFQSLLYAVSFYIHCLSSTLFRQEFQSQVKSVMGGKPSRVNAANMTQRERHAATVQISRKF